MQMEGFIPYAVWKHVLDALPGADFVEVSLPYRLMMLQKDEDELAAARYCASVGELACQEMLDVTRAGVTEAEIFAALTSVVYRAGLTLTPRRS
jgi:Xaa-Pro aminopeptidase